MARTKKAPKLEKERPEEDNAIYDMRTPLWSRYYERLRKSIRFPRYYKKAVNW
jgi:hypothetical protein